MSERRTPKHLRACWAAAARTAAATLLTLALAAVFGASAAARPLTLAVTPEAPTWEDAVILRASGEVETACGASIVRLTNVRKPSFVGPPPVIEVDLVEDPCLAPVAPAVVTFTAEVDLGHLPPGNATLIVHDLVDGGLVQRELLVYEVSRLGLDAPRSPAVAGEPVRVEVTHYDDCSSLLPSVAGHVVTIGYASGCAILPPPPSLQRVEVDVGPLAAGDYEVRLVEPFAGIAPALRRMPVRVWPSAGCIPSDEALCLRDGRFRLTATWRAFDGSTGVGHAVPLAGNDGSGLLWFFASDNAELTVKVLDACGVDGDWWVFVASASTVDYTLTVTDTRTGASRSYRNPLGNLPDLITDTDAFDCP